MSGLRAKWWRLLQRHPVAIVLTASSAVMAAMVVFQWPLSQLLRLLIMPAYVTWLGMVVVAVGISDGLPPIVLLPVLFLMVWLLDRFASAWIDE